MPTITISKTINTPVEAIFKAIADIRNLPETNPDILSVEFISKLKSGVGTRFVETRLMNGKESKTELEITELADNKLIRMVADSHGTVWDSVFTVESQGTGARLTLSMQARAHKLLPKLLNPLMKGLYKKGLEKHMDALKNYCEKYLST
jgi:uncharacterized protein YndB with AHSA1/START domain